MKWTLVTRKDTSQGNDKPFISVSLDHFSFNSKFVRQEGLDAGKRVLIHIDEDDRKIGFEFISDARDNSFALSRASAATKGKKRGALNCASLGVVRMYPWIESVAKLDNLIYRRFEPKKEGSLWAIQLCPAFEEKKARESANIPSDAVGIYRYIRENGQIVYIGRGAIKERLSSPIRVDWDFDTIEYSIIPDQINRYNGKITGSVSLWKKTMERDQFIIIWFIQRLAFCMWLAIG